MRIGSRPGKHRRLELEARARSMRHAPTRSEELLFSAVRGRRLGVRFRRQVVLLGRYIADLYAAEVRLVVEVDGPCHAKRARVDWRRDRALVAAGYRVLRVPAEVVERRVEDALERIRGALA